MQGSIAEIVDELVTLHASYKPRNVEELSESLEQVMAISILPEELTKQ